MTAYFHIFRNSLFPNFLNFRLCTRIIRVIGSATEYTNNDNNNSCTALGSAAAVLLSCARVAMLALPIFVTNY
jgi:hypothetical protein